MRLGVLVSSGGRSGVKEWAHETRKHFSRAKRSEEHEGSEGSTVLADHDGPSSKKLKIEEDIPEYSVANPTEVKKENITRSSSFGISKKMPSDFVAHQPYRSAHTASGGTSTASVWVGIDGFTCSTGTLQTGIDMTTISNGAVSYDAWYEWYPDYAYSFSGISLVAGDIIKLTVTASSTTSGTTVIENLSTGQTANAEWIVEDFEYYQPGMFFPSPPFGAVEFTNASATGPYGSYTPAGAVIFDIERNSSVLTRVSTSGSNVTIDNTCTEDNYGGILLITEETIKFELQVHLYVPSQKEVVHIPFKTQHITCNQILQRKPIVFPRITPIPYLCPDQIGDLQTKPDVTP
ncbi:peptidase A4 family-domain-containing protein [Melanogaster broomeanus]|nr:peptidase A4 family-domain-containing protein [Melanogaster broomeanus]